jgi:regulator of protease activity HflC (stomatin/prohibitin superfamily)
MYNERSMAPVVGPVVGFVLFVLLMFFTGTARVAPNEVGVLESGGAIDVHQVPLSPGWHFIAPFYQGYHTQPINQQNHQFSEVAAAAKNLQNVYVDGGVNYTVDPGKAAELTIQGGSESVINRVLWPAFQDYIKEVVPKYDTTEILVNREKIRNDVRDRLQGKTDQFGLSITDVFLTNIHFDKAYTQAIEDSAKAQQSLAKAKIDADTARTQAQGEADANRIKQQSLTPELISYMEVQKWNGVLPQVTGSSGTIISLPQPK